MEFVLIIVCENEQTGDAISFGFVQLFAFSPFKYRKCYGVEKTVTGDLNSSWALFAQLIKNAEYAMPTNFCLIDVLSFTRICELFCAK